MNLREGTRRLALLLGVVGAVLCGFFSYFLLQSTLEQSADHRRFEQLANSDAVQQERYLRFTKGQTGDIPNAKPDDPYAGSAQSQGGKYVWPSEVNKGGIKKIYWTVGPSVSSIETTDGQTIYPTPAPGARSYVLIATLPLLGFFIPWGVTRAIGWVVAGFVQPSK